MASFVDKLHPLVLNIGLAIHNADWNWKNVSSPFTRLYYVTEGTAQILISGKIQILKANHMYFIPAFTKHSYICNSYFSHYYLHIYEEHQSDNNLLDNWGFSNRNTCYRTRFGIISAALRYKSTYDLTEVRPYFLR